MIQHIAHAEPGGDPAGIGPALAVAHELHAPGGPGAGGGVEDGRHGDP
jgi:hypothetical protein